MKTRTRLLRQIAWTLQGAACLAMLVFATGNRAQAGDVYWDGTSSSWNPAAGWSTSSSATTPDPGAVPGSGDVVLFNISGVSGAQSLSLGANQAASKLKVLGSATGGATLLGGGTDRTLSLGTGGIEMLAGAGPLVIGSKLAGQGVPVALTGAQTWTNGCSNPLTVKNTISGISTATLTLSGAGGGFRFNGSNTFAGGITLKAGTVLGIDHDKALGTATFISDNGTLLVEDFPRTLANKILENLDLQSTWTGDGSLTLTGSGVNPAVAIGQYRNKPIYVNKTAPVLISGIWSLCNSTVPNNSGVAPTMASGANVSFTGEIRDFNTGNLSGKDSPGMAYSFTGTGAQLSIFGNNLNRGGPSVSMRVTPSSGAGYNSVSIGGPGGTGAVVTPMGVGALETSTGVGFFLKALVDGQIITNLISLSGSANGSPIGFDGENDLTLSGTYRVSGAPGNVTLPNLATGTLTFSGTVTNGTRTLTIQGPGETVFTSASTIAGSTGSFGKSGPGSLTLAGANNLVGATTLSGGDAILDYGTSNNNRLAQGTTATALTLAGVDLQLKGGNYAQALGIGGGTTIGSGQSTIRRTDGGTSTIALGALARANNLGSAVNFVSGVSSTTSGNTSGTLGAGGWATVDGTDWAVSNGTISALGAYNSFTTPGTDKNILLNGTASIAAMNINTLKIAPTGAAQSLAITTSGTLSLDRRGLLFVGPHDFTVTGGTIRGRSADYQADLIVQQYGSGTLTISSVVGNGNSTALVKAGPGTLVLSNPANTFSGVTFILDGVLSVSENGNLGTTGSVNLNGGTLRTTAGFTTPRAISLGANGGTFDVVTNTLALSGIVSSGYGALNKIGAGTLLLSGTNTYSGPTTVSEGTLKLGYYLGLGSASTNANRAVSPVYVKNGAVLDIAGKNAWIGNFTLVDGTVADSVAGGKLGAYSFTMNKGTVNAVLADVKVPVAANTFNSINLFKRTADTVTLTATNTYSGTTFVEAGTLRVNGSLASSVIVQTNGTLSGTGTLTRTVNVENGGIFAPGADASGSGSMTLGRHLRIDGNGALKVGIGASGSGCVVMTNPQARALLEDAVLDVSILSGGVSVLAAGVTLINNQGSGSIEGSFLGLPEGSTLEIGSGRFASITYAGGDGNDVVLALQNRASVLVVR